MFTLIFLTFFVFAILWVGDLYITIKTVKKKGTKVELNPLMRLLLHGKAIWIFKVVELGLFLYLLYFVTQISTGVVPFYILLGYILLFTIIVANNSRVYSKITGETSTVFHYIFIGIAIALTFFIYMNYLMYTGLTLSYNTLMDCQSNYKQLNWECYGNDTGIQSHSTSQLEEILKTLDIPIPRP